MKIKKSPIVNSKKPQAPAIKLKKGHSDQQNFLLVACKWLIVISIWFSIFLLAIFLWYSHGLPNTAKIAQSTRKASVTLLSKNGNLLATYGDLYGHFIELKDVPPYVPQAILAIEDRRFYQHFGVDLFGIVRAAWANYRSGSIVQGGSTLTQQLAKNLLLTEGLYKHTDRSFRRKMQELILALYLEAKLTKQQILQIYMNRMYLGAGVYGIDAAARKYFHKCAAELTIYEAAVIAGILKAPSKYSPTNDAILSNQRAQVVLNNMVQAGFIDAQVLSAIDQDQLKMVAINAQSTAGRYFADWVFESLRGLIGEIDQDVIVHTTLDNRLQKLAEYRVKSMIMTEGFAANAHQSALIAITPSGAVRAMVGGIDYASSQFNRAVQAKRQIGSTFKVFVYLAALENGMTPDSFISDGPIKIGEWTPKNYKWQARGDVTLRTAMAYSLNTPVIRLTQQIGLRKVKLLAARLGLTSVQPDNLTIALGAGEANLLELTSAYATITNHGYTVWPYAVTQVQTVRGKILYKRQAQPAQCIIAAHNVAHILSMMQTVMQEGTGRNIKLDRPCAGKSGTSQNYKDAWFIGFTPDLVTGVWMGNDDSSPMDKISGGKLPGQLWHDFMQDVHKNLPKKYFPH